jgi:hypothetical protein
MPWSASDERFFEDVPATPYREGSTAHPSFGELADRFAHRTAFPLIPEAASLLPGAHNPHTLLEALLPLRQDQFHLRDFLLG